MKANLKEMELPELEAFVVELGAEKYRARQVFQWIYRGASSFDEMTDLPSSFREKLKETAELVCLSLVKCQRSKADGTRKYLFALFDGNAIESVWMKYKFGSSICVSSQAGCGRGCSFCASGKDGLARNLSAGEMVDQVLAVQRDAGEKINHVTVMGTGEPFDNYEQLSRFLRLINRPEGLGIGARSITVSTCGVAPMIGRFGQDFPQVNLAVSLHGANDETRNALMPVGRAHPFQQLLAACKAYTEQTNRRITFEYALIKGKNDEPKAADELAEKLGGMLCHVNLIPFNPVSATGFYPTDAGKAAAFQERLERRGIAATVRRPLGKEIDAACGQLVRSVFA